MQKLVKAPGDNKLFNLAYHSSAGRFSVIDPSMRLCSASIYNLKKCQKPKNPIMIYKRVTVPMAMFIAPNLEPILFGSFIWFSRGKTTPIPSNA